MKNINIIVAMTASRVIGFKGGIPWKLPQDMRHFKETTMGHAVIMGRKTHESIGRRLPGRANIVLTGASSFSAGASVAPDCHVAHYLGGALDIARGLKLEPFIIGGARVYAEALPLATRIFLTEVNGEYEGEVFFHEFDRTEWTETSRRRGEACSFVTLEREVSE